MAAFSQALRDSDDQETVLLCLEGFRSAIRISCVFGLQVCMPCVQEFSFMLNLLKFYCTKISVCTYFTLPLLQKYHLCVYVCM